MKKRILSILLVLVLLVGMLPLQIFAAEIPAGVQFTAVTADVDGEITVTKLENVKGGDLYSNGYGELVHAHITVPAGTKNVTVTYPGELDQWTMSVTMSEGTNTVKWRSTATVSGNTITIPVADYIAVIGSSGWESGTGVTAEVGYTPIEIITFEIAGGSVCDHEWADATCTAAKTCSKCGATDGDALGHAWNDGEEQTAATCYAEGEMLYTCTRCGGTEERAISKTEHSWNTGEVTKEATCKEAGERTFTCTVEACGEKKWESIAKLTTHTYEGENAEFCKVCGADNPDYVDPNMPQQVDGVYQIGSAEELLSFAKFVNKGNTNLSAALTADIDLTGKTWTPMSSSNAAFSFDGQGHTITFDNAENGLFAVLRGKWGSDEYRIVSYATVSNVIISGSINGAGNVGAIAGEAYGVKITQCVNHASVIGSGKNVGGMIGLTDRTFRGIHYSNIAIDQCANIGSVQGSSGVGGLIGGMSHSNSSYLGEIKNSYNWGAVTGSKSGGLIGDARLNATSNSAVTIQNCYNAGNPTALIGYGDSRANITNSYFLSETDTSDRAKTEVEMKSADFVTTLGDYFRKGSTYPVLVWQAAGDAKEYAVTAPTTAGITFHGANVAYDNEDYAFTVTINDRYRATENFAITVNGDPITDYTESNGVYSCSVPKAKITQDLEIAVTGVEATKTVIYAGNTLPASYGYVAEIAVDDVTVTKVQVNLGETTGSDFTTTENTIEVTLAEGTDLNAPVYFTVTTGGGNGAAILGISPGKTFTRNLAAGGLTEVITATMANTGKATWTVLVKVDGVTSHQVTKPTGTGFTVEGPSAVVDGQDYTFTVKINSAYTGANMVVKAGETTLTPDEEGGTTYTVENVRSDLNITVEGVEKKPYEQPFTKILLGGSELSADKIALKTEDFLALQELTVPYFDLARYGLESLYYNPDCYDGASFDTLDSTTFQCGTPESANGKVTVLHMLIYATEIYCYNVEPQFAGMGYLKTEVWDKGATNYLDIDPIVGKIFFDTFWDFGENMTYFVNYNFPLGAVGVGATAEQILLQEGAIITARYDENKPTIEENGTYYHFGEKGDRVYNVTQGDELTLTLYATGGALGNQTSHAPAGAGHNVYLTSDKAPSSHTGLTAVGTTDASGQITLDTSGLEGTYYVTTNTHDPAVAIVEVTASGTTPDPDPDPPAGKPGDFDGSGAVDMPEVMNVIKQFKKSTGLTAEQFAQIDTSGNGALELGEVMKVIKAYKGLS